MFDGSPDDLERLDAILRDLERYRMPFGRYGAAAMPPEGAPLYDLPIEYLAWFAERGFPRGRLGELMAFVYEVKSVGAEEIFRPLRRAAGGRHPLRRPPRWRTKRKPASGR